MLTLRLARPDKKNALTADMYAALAGHIERAQGDPEVAVLLLTAAGDAFCAGNDIADFVAMAEDPDRPADLAEPARPVRRFLHALADNQKPLLAAVNGLAVGVGFTLLLHCDLVYAGGSAVLSAPFVDLGLIPEAASTLLLPALLGPAKASELLLLAEPLGAKDAERLGIVTRVFADEELAAQALARAKTLARKPRAAVVATRKLLRPDPETLKQRMAVEGEIFARQLRSEEARQAFAAFLSGQR